MVITHFRAKRKPSGGRYIACRKKRKYEIGRAPSLTKLDEKKVKRIRTKGGGEKLRILKMNVVNLFDPSTKTYSQSKIKTVSGNPANTHFVRRNILTKGAIVVTEKGKARITSRPGQEGAVNAVLIG